MSRIPKFYVCAKEQLIEARIASHDSEASLASLLLVRGIRYLPPVVVGYFALM